MVGNNKQSTPWIMINEEGKIISKPEDKLKEWKKYIKEPFRD